MAKKEAGQKPKKMPAANTSADNLPKEDALRMFSPGPRYWVSHAPDVKGMSTLRLQDEVAQIDEFLSRQTSSSPDTVRLEDVRRAMYAEAMNRGKGVTKRGGAKKGKRPKRAQAEPDAGVPRILRERSSVATEDPNTHVRNPATVAREYDEIVAYLQRDDVSRGDRKILQTELANLKPLVAEELRRRASQRLEETIDRSLAADESIRDPREQIRETIRRIDSIRPVSGRPGWSYLMHGNERVEMPDAAADAIRKQAWSTLDQIASEALVANNTLGEDYQEFVDRTFNKHKYVGFVSILRSGENPSEWEDDILKFRQVSNQQAAEYLNTRRDPWSGNRETLGPLAEKALAANRVAEAGRTWFDYKQGLVLEGTAGAIRYLHGVKELGKIASTIAFKPLGAAAYAAVESLAEQGMEVHYGQRDKIDYLGVGLDAAANAIGSKAGGLIPGAGPEASALVRGASWLATDRVTAAATTAARMGLANTFEHGHYSAGDIAGAVKEDLTDVGAVVQDALTHQVGKRAHAQHERSKAEERRAKEEKTKGEEQGDQPKSQASATVLTQQPVDVKPLELPVVEINNPAKGKGVLAESQVPSHLYQGPEWNHIGGGEETASSRTSIARETEWGNTGGNDFLVENVETDRLVIGEQKAVDSDSFTNASAISTVLLENVRNTKQKVRDSIETKKQWWRDTRNQDMPPEEIARLERTVARLDATEKALESGSPLPDGVVFEFTNVGGEGKAVGKEHVNRLEEAFDKPGYVEHLLSRTFVRDPKLAKEKGRDPTGKRGTDADPDIVPALDILTPQARDTVDRIRAGKNETQWEAQKAKQKAQQAKTEKDAREAQKQAAKKQREAEEKQARADAKKQGEEARKERLRQLREEQKQRNEPKPTTKKGREQAKKKLEREAANTGKSVEKKAIDEFKTKRKEQTDADRAKRKADENAQAEARRKQREADAQLKAQREAAEKTAKQRVERVKKMTGEEWKNLPKDERKELEGHAKNDKDLAGAMAEKEGSLKTPESLLRMNQEAREKHEAAARNARMGKAAHYMNTAAAGMRAIDKFHEELDKGKSYSEATYEAGKTYLENTNPVIGAFGIAQSRMQKDDKGEQYYGDDAVDAWLGTIGETAAGYIVPGSGTDQLVNAGANLSGAIDDHLQHGKDPNDPSLKKANLRTATDLAADVTPSRMFSQVIGAGMRSYYDIGKAIGGDTHGVDKFADDALKGKLGSVIQPWAMAADFFGNLGSDSAGVALEKTVKKTEGTTLKKIGDAAGDAMFDLGQSAEAKSGKYGMGVQGVSMALGITTDMIAGQSFEKALDKAVEPGKGSAANVIGTALGDAAFTTVEKGKEILNEDIPAAKERLKSWWKSL
jgi:hypothetical protein